MRVQGFELRVACFVSRFSGFEFLISGLGRQTPEESSAERLTAIGALPDSERERESGAGFGFRVSRFMFRVLGLESRVLGFQVSDSGRFQVSGLGMQNPEGSWAEKHTAIGALPDSERCGFHVNRLAFLIWCLVFCNSGFGARVSGFKFQEEGKTRGFKKSRGSTPEES